MKDPDSFEVLASQTALSRRDLLKTGLLAGGAAYASTLLATLPAFAQSGDLADTLVYAHTNSGSQRFDPHMIGTGALDYVTSPVFDTLLTVDAQGNYAPGLATEWTFSADKTALTLKLRDKVKFHDGGVCDAEAVKASIERGKTFQLSAVKNALAPISEIKVVDPLTVELAISSRFGEILGTLASAAGAIVSPAASGREDFVVKPVGTGPWMVAEAQPGTKYRLTAFPDYWDPSVQGVKTIEIPLIPPEAIVNALMDGSATLGAVRTTAADAAQLAGRGLQQVDASKVTWIWEFLLNKQGIFANEALRQALSYGIDRKELCQTIFKTLVYGDSTPNSQSFNPNTPWYNSDVAPIAYDPAKVKELLAKGGHPDGFEFTIVVFAGNPQYETSAQAIQAQLARVGIKMTIVPMATTAALSARANGTHDAFYSAIVGTGDPANWVNTWSSPANNPGKYADPQIADLATQGSTETDFAKRQEIYRKLSARFQETVFHLTVANAPQIYFAQAGVKGLSIQDGPYPQFRGVTVGKS